MKSTVDLQVFKNTPALGQAAARQWLDVLGQNPNDPFFVALSGGRSADALFSELARQKNANLLTRVDFFWADERCVLPADRQSNYFSAEELLFRPLGISETRIHRLQGELSPEVAVEKANEEVKNVIPMNESDLPVFDLVLLGLGEDGHIASLFPNASLDIIHCRDAYMHVENSPKPPAKRISLSYAAIAAAKRVWVLAVGAAKEPALRQSLDPSAKTPLALLLELHQGTKIFTDFDLKI